MTIIELEQQLTQPSCTTGSNKKTAILRLHGGYNLIEYPRKELQKVLADLRERCLILQGGLDTPTATDRFVLTLLQEFADGHREKAKVKKTMKPKLLEFQPDDESGLGFFTHFDCWTNTGGSDCDVEDIWDWDSGKAVNLVWALMRQAWALTDDENYMHFAEKYLELGQRLWFEELANRFVASGYCVYNSDAYFEVYDPELVKPSEHEDK